MADARAEPHGQNTCRPALYIASIGHCERSETERHDLVVRVRPPRRSTPRRPDPGRRSARPHTCRC
eukprot:5918370-Prymnesium_polylepis.1